MRTPLLLLGALLALALSPSLLAQARPSYTDAEAAGHAGEDANVTGKVFGVSTRGSVTFINVGAAFPNHTFTGVVFSGDQEKVGDLQQYNGKTVTISGKIEMRQDKPQIVIKSPEQIRLGEAGATTPPAVPGPAPAAPMAKSTTPAAPTVAATTATSPAPAAPAAEARRIALAPNWDTPPQGGTMTRKDLSLLFTGQGASSEAKGGEAAILVYADIPYLTPLIEARKRLRLDATAPAKSRVTCPGLPAGSLTAHVFNGVFEGGFNRLILVTDNSDQVVSALAIDENSRQRVQNEPDATGYHTYNFIQHRVKGNDDLVIRHQIAPSKGRVVLVDSMLIDPHDTDGQPKPRTSTSRTSSTTSIYSRSKSGKVLERSRWHVPAPLVELILRSAGGSR
jgi:hypothetical protein